MKCQRQLLDKTRETKTYEEQMKGKQRTNEGKTESKFCTIFKADRLCLAYIFFWLLFKNKLEFC